MGNLGNHLSLDRLGHVSRGVSRHRPRNDNILYGGKYPLIQTAEVTNSGLYISKYTQTYSDAGLAQSKLWKPETLCIVNAGVNTGDCSILSFSACFPDSVIGFTANNQVCNVRYVKYYIDTIKPRIQSMTMGATQDNLSVSKLLTIKIPAPPLPIQRKIAAVLSAYDDLIENNNRRIALLEKMGEELYLEWFVRLRFLGHESTKIVKGVPEGWTVESIGSVSKMVKRGISPVYDEASSSLVLNQKCIRNGKVNLEPARKHSSKVPNEKFLQKFDVLVNSTGVGTLGRVAVFTAETESLTVDSHVTIARANPDKINRLYYAGILCTKQEYFENLAIGATGQVELNKDGIERVQFLLPPNELQKQFGLQKAALLQLIEKTQQKQAALTLSRDRLLTRLMSGKIDLEALDIAFPPSMQEVA